MSKHAAAELDRTSHGRGDGNISSRAYHNIVGSPADYHPGTAAGQPAGGHSGKELSFGTDSSVYASVHDAPVATGGDRGLPETQGSLQQAVGGANKIDWTTPEQNKQSGQQPNYILKPDGTLQLVHQPDSPNAKINVEVENGNKSLNEAIKQANENQKKAIKDLITIWKKDHPNEAVPGDWLDQLNSQPTLLPTGDNGGSSPQSTQPTDTGSSGGSSGGGVGGDGGGGGGGSGGGGGGGGGGFSGGGEGGSGGGSGGGFGGGSGGSGDQGLNPSGASLSGGETATSNQIMNMLINQYGLSAAGAAGVVGNMTQENSLGTEANSGGLGLCQWTGDRASACEAYASAHGESATSVQAQVGFMMQELSKDYPGLLQELKTTNNAQQAALDFSQQYERPGDPQNGNRESYAQSALNNYNSSSHHA